MNDPYHLLGLTPAASRADVVSAYRKLRARTHPDRNPNDPEAAARFRDIQAAYEAITAPPKPSYGATDGFGADIFDQEFADIFNTVLNAAANSSASKVHQEHVIQVGFDQALTGAQMNISVQGHRFALHLPPGVRQADRLRVDDAGRTFVLVVRVEDKPGWYRDGDDIHGTLEVPIWTAALGGDIQWPTWSGLTRVSIPAGTRSDQVLRLSGVGAINPITGHRGHLFAHLVFVVPPMNAKQKTMAQALHKTFSKK